MIVSDLHMVYLRAQISGEEGIMRRVLNETTRAHGMDGLVPLVYEAFLIAVRKKFSPEFTRSEVIRFVAHVRALLSERPDLIDPAAAEAEIMRALGQNVPAFREATARSAAQIAVLDVLVHDMDLDEQAIADLLDEARQKAENRARQS